MDNRRTTGQGQILGWQVYYKTIINKTGVINDPLGQPQTRPAVIVAWFWSFRTDGRTFCVKIVFTTGRDCGRPRGSTSLANLILPTRPHVEFVVRFCFSVVACFTFCYWRTDTTRENNDHQNCRGQVGQQENNLQWSSWPANSQDGSKNFFSISLDFQECERTGGRTYRQHALNCYHYRPWLWLALWIN